MCPRAPRCANAWRRRAARGHTLGLVGPGARFSVLEIADPPSTLAVGTLQPFIDGLIERGGAKEVDYVHGDDALERLALNHGCIGFHLAGMGKSELMRRVVHEGPTPRKTFSMGEAHEKRFYIEARRIGSPKVPVL
jgi:NADPH-dependent ferric siderophore reductase